MQMYKEKDITVRCSVLAKCVCLRETLKADGGKVVQLEHKREAARVIKKHTTINFFFKRPSGFSVQAQAKHMGVGSARRNLTLNSTRHIIKQC